MYLAIHMTNWDEIRKEFPVTENSTYLNAAAAGPLSRATMAAATEYYRQMMDDADIHWDEWLSKREEVRRRVAAFINAEPDEIALTTNTSSGMNVIIDALENHGEVVSCELEFPVSTLPWMNRRIPVHLVKPNDGMITVDAIREAMNVRTGIICMSQVQYSNGFRMDLEALGNVKGAHALVVNASQAAGAFAVDVKRLKIDALCATGHKWMLSGYGSGFVYLSRELQERSRPRAIGWLSVEDPYSDRNNEIHLRHDAAARTELGCPHFAGMFALGASVEMLSNIGMENIETRVLRLNTYLTDRLLEAGWKVLSPIENENTRSAETLVEASDPEGVVAKLAEQGIIVTKKPQGFRVATHFFNNEDDVERLIMGLERCRSAADLRGYRQISKT
ncbi:MAG TPA: aminotransferase class V-fold PLP-dependent enzyme [Pyrinomonadaceae bacterium]|nr:aminotransferase class V-fold PLP-dependent enzyme [Pyrinomonadaceae bacterium]